MTKMWYDRMASVRTIGNNAAATDGKRLRGKEKGRARKGELCRRALVDIDAWLGNAAAQAAE